MLIDYAAHFEARCAGVTFTGRRFDHTPGVYVREVEGLMGGGSTKYDSLPSGLSAGDGEADAVNRREDPRIISITGFVYERTMIELGHTLRRLDALLTGSAGLAEFQWDEFGETFSTRVRRGQTQPPRRRGATRFADYTMRFRAPSQPYFGEKRTAGPGSTILLRNEGTFQSAPVFTVTGNMPSGYKLVSGGVEYVVAQALAPGQTHRIDMRTLLVQRNGVAQVGAAASPRFIGVPAHSVAAVALVPAAGSGQISSEWSDAYI